MANYFVGLDFGTSQTKVCILNEDSGIREFVKFKNDSYFLPSLITRKEDKTFSYGNELESGCKYRYFKMSAAEDDQLIQITNENLHGELKGNIDDYRKYSTNDDIQAEMLVVLYLAYIYMYVKSIKSTTETKKIGGLLGKLTSVKSSIENNFSVNLGIPTEWHNPEHFKRRVKFESLLISSIKLAKEFRTIDDFLLTNEKDLVKKIFEINRQQNFALSEISAKDNSEIIKQWLKDEKLSVFPESAAGVNYLLQDNKLKESECKYIATLDIGAGTSDLAIFQLTDDKIGLKECFCSESVEIASNDFYKEYAVSILKKEQVNFEEINNTEKLIRLNSKINDTSYNAALKKIRGNNNGQGIEFSIRKTFYRKFYKPIHKRDQAQAFTIKNNMCEASIIVFGGGANLRGFSEDNYYYFPGTNPYQTNACYFKTKEISDYVQNVDINNWNNVKEYINLLILALGLTYKNTSSLLRHVNLNYDETLPDNLDSTEKYFYYDLQDAAFK